MSTPTKRPSAENRTPQESPTAIARGIAQLATAPLASFGAMINDDDRDQQWQRLVTRLTADWPDVWSKAKEDDVEERLRANLPTDDDRKLLFQLGEHHATKAAIRENAAYLVGFEVGRCASGVTPEPVSTTVDDTAPASTQGDHSKDVSEVMIRLVSVLWLAKSVADCQIGDVAKVNHYAWFALSDLLEKAATDLDEAHGRYCTESNALHAAAEAGGAR